MTRNRVEKEKAATAVVRGLEERLPLPIQKALPGLRNFWLAGQWVEPGGGIPMVGLSGRNVVQLICHQDEKQRQSRA